MAQLSEPISNVTNPQRYMNAKRYESRGVTRPLHYRRTTRLHELMKRAAMPLPVPGALADPTLELHDVNGALIVANDNWRSDQEAEIIATGLPPSSDLESAIVRNLTPGNYTAIVRGVNSATGIALVEAYGLN